jgi:hypothetical protein
MVHLLVTAMDVRLMDTRERVAAAARVAAVRPDRRPAPVAGLWRTWGARLLGILADSREPFPSKDLEMAGYGLRRGDPAADRALARELWAARQRRRARSAGSPPLPVLGLADRSAGRRTARVAFSRRPCLGIAE